jgi:large subunit ribosomal protein L29
MSLDNRTKELRAKTAADLEQELLSLTKAQFGLRMQAATQQLSNNSQLGKVRRDIARVKTILTEKGAQQ